jgi:hypothetical protein
VRPAGIRVYTNLLSVKFESQKRRRGGLQPASAGPAEAGLS